MGFLSCKYQIISGVLLLSLNFPFILTSSPNTSSSCLPSQSLALLQLKKSFTVDSFSPFICQSTSPASHSGMETWIEGVDCCSWRGVTCDKHTGNVIGLDLSCTSLQGSINNSNTLFLLSNLQVLNLAFNEFGDSPIPSGLGQLTSLTYLNLSNSGFSGFVASELSHLAKLVSLDLSDNNQLQFRKDDFKKLLQNLTQLRDLVLDGTDMSLIAIDSFINLSSNLVSLRLSGCYLQGNLPESVFRLPNLQKLDIEMNGMLNISFPKFNWSSSLTTLKLNFNGFAGYIPNSIGNLQNLEVLDLDNGGFVGSLPTSIGNLAKLKSMILSYNHFTGPIPLSLSDLSSLVELQLHSNNLTSPIPDAFDNLTILAQVDMSYNYLSGQIPLSLFNLKQLVELNLDRNQLTDFPSGQIHGLSALTTLTLSNNLLNSAIPSWLFTLPSLKSLDLQNNRITGQIPEFQSKSLEVIHLQNNMMHGPIPSSIFQLVNASDINLSSNNFNGSLDLDLFSNLPYLTYVDLSDNSLSVKVDNQGNYTWPMLYSLVLSSCNLTEFPQFLSNQTRLWYLSLAQNNIHGEIPTWLWLLGSNSLRYLLLSHNFLSSIGKLPMQGINLSLLDLRFNLIHDPLWPLINMIQSGGYMYHESYDFLFSNNNFTGEIPSTICNITSLATLDLSNNSLSGKIPECLASLTQLEVLNLRMNNFSGFIPQNFWSEGYPMGSRLATLDLGGNRLEGPLPKSLANCSSLEVLDVRDNMIEDEFPRWLESLPNLQVLVLRSNKFHGLIGEPSSATPFAKLRIVDISNNFFDGPLPKTYFQNFKAMTNVQGQRADIEYMGPNLYYQDSLVITIKDNAIMYERVLTIMTTVDFSRNRFEGTIPDDVGNLIFLIGLNFSHNNLSGSIPSSLANIFPLESLDLSYNRLRGEIPQGLNRLTFLAVLGLAYNQLEGPIPRGNQFDTFTNVSYLGNLQLCGPPLSKGCSNGEANPPLPLASQDDDNSPWGFRWRILMIGYGTGLVIGLSTAYMVFKRGEPLWFSQMVQMLQKQLNRNVKRPNRTLRRQRN